MTDAELDAAIAAQPYEKVTKESIEARIKSVSYQVLPDSTVTLCNIVLDNGHSERGESVCVDPRNFNMTTGREIAYRQAFAKFWVPFGFLLRERQFLASQANK
jgi:hypothetical protein